MLSVSSEQLRHILTYCLETSMAMALINTLHVLAHTGAPRAIDHRGDILVGLIADNSQLPSFNNRVRFTHNIFTDMTFARNILFQLYFEENIPLSRNMFKYTRSKY